MIINGLWYYVPKSIFFFSYNKLLGVNASNILKIYGGNEAFLETVSRIVADSLNIPHTDFRIT